MEKSDSVSDMFKVLCKQGIGPDAKEIKINSQSIWGKRQNIRKRNTAKQQILDPNKRYRPQVKWEVRGREEE